MVIKDKYCEIERTINLEFVKKEMINTYKITESERISLVVILSVLDEKGEIKLLTTQAKNWLKIF
ncbi:hypothetical protein BAVI_15296 [Neobacillus vireti LMG 21834]|uniref:Uncharacterized protein n=1 Tax=Neobacillus vireti LMG 21834 TaxID=1131730 RepID=A0AB94ILB9_9BACI|nr:hypothetical protein BAVI_15296 [Neobacillus vireti LMG 21834]